VSYVTRETSVFYVFVGAIKILIRELFSGKLRAIDSQLSLRTRNFHTFNYANNISM